LYTVKWVKTDVIFTAELNVYKAGVSFGAQTNEVKTGFTVFAEPN